MPATTRQLQQAMPADDDVVVAERRALAGPFAAITTIDGAYITGGLIDLISNGATWTACLTRLDQPGVLASSFFGKRLREVILRLPDGRQLRARIAGTSFVAASERICHLTGIDPLPAQAQLTADR